MRSGISFGHQEEIDDSVNTYGESGGPSHLRRRNGVTELQKVNLGCGSDSRNGKGKFIQCGGIDSSCKGYHFNDWRERVDRRQRAGQRLLQ